jgi:hypothetical protein
MPVRPADITQAFFAGRFTPAAAAERDVFAHVVIERGEAAKGAAAMWARVAWLVGFVVVAEHFTALA